MGQHLLYPYHSVDAMTSEQNKNYSILIVDDEPLIRQSLYEIFKIEGFKAEMAQSGEEALSIVKEGEIDIVLTDLKLPEMSGIDLLNQIKADGLDCEVILITGFGSIESAVEAIKAGAYDYISKPINDNEVKLLIEKIVEKREIIKENRDLKAQLAKSSRTSFCGLVGGSEKMLRVYQTIESIANSNATILVNGESGTGKGLVARAIHESDQARCNEPFVEVSCGALTETLLESELFGHVKGAFTGAIKDKEGRFEYAKSGTIFLDEIDAFSPTLQVKLLRVLQDGEYERVGDNKTQTTNARIIVATNQDLTELIEKGTFREDLYYRINVIYIDLPPLRERKDDIELLATKFIEKYSKSNNKKVKGMSDEVKKMFLGYEWPGNIRELENAVEGAIIMASTEVINKWDIPNASKFTKNVVKSADGRSLKKSLEEPERKKILTVLNNCNWNRIKAAAMLGINRTTLYNKMKKYNINKR